MNKSEVIKLIKNHPDIEVGVTSLCIDQCGEDHKSALAEFEEAEFEYSYALDRMNCCKREMESTASILELAVKEMGATE